MELDITPKEFNLFREYIYKQTGISLSEKKITLVRGRLSKRIRKLGLKNFSDYYNLVVEDNSGEELTLLIDSISTNVTSFFREAGQWEFLKNDLQNILKRCKNRRLRIWSAACSSGEEPYSILMFLQENMKDFNLWDIKILATDISNQILLKASKGEYQDKSVETVPKHVLAKNFNKINKGNETLYVVKDFLKDRVVFRSFNLINGDFAIFKNKFDMIFCRNVMIYFDGESQKKLVSEYAKLLERGSYLFVGHSESLTRNKDEFKLVKASIYERI